MVFRKLIYMYIFLHNTVLSPEILFTCLACMRYLLCVKYCLIAKPALRGGLPCVATMLFTSEVLS